MQNSPDHVEVGGSGSLAISVPGDAKQLELSIVKAACNNDARRGGRGSPSAKLGWNQIDSPDKTPNALSLDSSKIGTQIPTNWSTTTLDWSAQPQALAWTATEEEVPNNLLLSLLLGDLLLPKRRLGGAGDEFGAGR